MKLKRSLIVVLVAAAVLILAGCQGAAPQGTAAKGTQIAVPQVAGNPSAGGAESTQQGGYPAPQEAYPAGTGPTQAGGQTGDQYPGPGQAGAPAAENASRVTAKLIERSADPTKADSIRLHAEILTSEPVGSQPDQTKKLINQQVDLYTPATGLPDLKPGDTFEAQVSLQGDEHSGRYNATQVRKTNP